MNPLDYDEKRVSVEKQLTAENVSEKQLSASENASLEQPEENTSLDNDLPPTDKGIAWIAMIGSTLGLYTSFGYINVVGLFEAYYLHHQLSQYSASTVSWITSLQAFILLGSGVITGRLVEMYGPRKLAIVGTAFTVTGIMTTSVCTKYWHFILAQGICTSIGNSCVYYASIVSVSTWFKKHRATAMGVVVAGSSVGGLTLPFVFSNLQPRIGFPQTVRAIGFIMLGACVICCVTISSRIPPNKELQKKFFDFKTEVKQPLTSLSFCLMVFALFFSYWGLLGTMGYLSTHAIAHGVSQKTAFYIISIYNAASIVGRIGPGVLADKFGTYNLHACSCFLCGILILAWWIPAKSNGTILSFAGVFGFATGPYTSLFAALVADITPPAEIGRRLGVVTLFVSIAALTAMPIAGATLDKEHTKFVGLQVFAGVTMLVGGCFVLASKLAAGKGWLEKF